jgi:transcriptional regulator with XRE-family HTH domain
MTRTVTDQVRRAIQRAPCSLRALSRASGVDVSSLSRIQSGEREATLDVATAVADALETWSAHCAAAARAIRQRTKRGTR